MQLAPTLTLTVSRPGGRGKINGIPLPPSSQGERVGEGVVSVNSGTSRD